MGQDICFHDYMYLSRKCSIFVWRRLAGLLQTSGPCDKLRTFSGLNNKSLCSRRLLNDFKVILLHHNLASSKHSIFKATLIRFQNIAVFTRQTVFLTSSGSLALATTPRYIQNRMWVFSDVLEDNWSWLQTNILSSSNTTCVHDSLKTFSGLYVLLNS